MAPKLKQHNIKEPIVKINKYYKDKSDGTISKLISVTHRHNNNYATLYEMLIIKEGKYPSLNRNPLISYTTSAMLRCKELTDAEILAVKL